MDNKFQELSTLDFKKADIGLRETELIKEYSKLKFNGGFVLETIECYNSEKIQESFKIHISIPNDCAMKPTADDIKDFMYYMLGNQSLTDLGIYLGNGEEFY
jgi:hypothetical protein